MGNDRMQESDRKCLIQQLNSDNDDKSVMSSLIPRTTKELCPKLLREGCRMRKASGFTLIEMIMVIVITGIIGGMVAVFLKAPIQQYMDVSRRAELTDIADTALYHLAGDISTAVPNSVRVATPASPCVATGTTPCYVEFLPTIDGARYRANAKAVPGACAGGDELTFSTTPADTCFEVVGPPTAASAVGSAYIDFPISDSLGNPAYDTTSSGGLRKITAVAVSGTVQSITMTSAAVLPGSANNYLFYVLDSDQQAVTYACENVGLDAGGKEGVGKLIRYWKYGFNLAQAIPPITIQAAVPPNTSPVLSATLADKISECTIKYTTQPITGSPYNPSWALLEVTLKLTSGGEDVRLYKEIHVLN